MKLTIEYPENPDARTDVIDLVSGLWRKISRRLSDGRWFSEIIFIEGEKEVLEEGIARSLPDPKFFEDAINNPGAEHVRGLQLKKEKSAMSRWIDIQATSPSGKQQFVCKCCGRVSVYLDKECPMPARVNDGTASTTCAGIVDCAQWEQEQELWVEMTARRYVDLWLEGGKTERSLLIEGNNILLFEDREHTAFACVPFKVVEGKGYVALALALHRRERSEKQAKADIALAKSNLKTKESTP